MTVLRGFREAVLCAEYALAGAARCRLDRQAMEPANLHILVLDRIGARFIQWPAGGDIRGDGLCIQVRKQDARDVRGGQFRIARNHRNGRDDAVTPPGQRGEHFRCIVGRFRLSI